MDPSCVLPWAAVYGSGLGVPSLVTWRPWWAGFPLHPHADLGSRAWPHPSLTSGDIEASVAELGLCDRRASAWAPPCPSLLSSKGPFFNPTPACLFPCGDNGQLDQRRWASHIGLGVGLDRVIQALWAPGGIGPEAWVDSSVNGQEEQQGGVTVCGTADRLLGQPGFLSGRSGEVLLCVSPEPLLLHTPSLCHVEEDRALL